MFESLMDFLARWFGPSAGATAAATSVDAPADSPVLTTVEVSEVQNLVRRATEVTSTVAQHVGNHQTTIQTLNTALAAVAQGDATAVAAVVCKLLMANQELQGQLERAELKLEVHTRQLHDAVTAARTDSLTGLMNRRALDEEMIRSLSDFQRRARPAALMLLDVDRFKRFNDVHGHVGGDHALAYVADVLRTHSRESDVVARFGGEEFAIIFTGATAIAVQQRAEEIRAALAAGRVVFEGREARLTASAGVADITPNDDLQTWIKRADAALYAAKASGRACSFRYDPDACQRIVCTTAVPASSENEETPGAPPRREAAAELATEAFADTTFVSHAARRIAEWRRGGTTFSVILARLDCSADESDSADGHTHVRAALLLARDCVRDMDLLTRWTNDGLAILLPGTGVIDAKSMARRLRDALARCETQASGGERISMSMGIAEGIEGNDAHRVLHRAWLALDSAQCAGPATIFVHDGAKSIPIKALSAAR